MSDAPDALIAVIVQRLAAVRQRIAAAARSAGRDPATVTLVAVAKTHPEAAIRAALAAGQMVFAENRVQEAKAKYPGLRTGFPGLRLHLIGPLQTNKVREAVALADVVETLDRPRLAIALAEEMARTGRRPDCLIQVNTGAEPQKAGVLPDQADALIDQARGALALPVVGLMCIPPVAADPAPHFRLLAAIARRHGLARLSMGMSGDFEIAVAEGATHVRVGTAIFGGRPAA